MTDLTKDVNETKDWTLDYTSELGTDTIASSAWTVPAGITKTLDTFLPALTTIWLSGGSAGTTYVFLNTVITGQGRTYEKSLQISVIDATTNTIAPVIINTGLSSNTANSYCTKAQASAVGGYFETRLFNNAWIAASAEDRKRALIWATRLLDDNIIWLGTRSTQAQSLAWPRFYVIDIDGWPTGMSAYPASLVNATAEFALWLLQTDRAADKTTLGFSNIRVGDIDVQINAHDRDLTGPIPDQVRQMLDRLGAVQRARGATVVKLVRA